jgi:hypothetical protein
MDYGELVGGSWVEGGSPRRPVDGGEVGREKVADGGADERVPDWNFGSASRRGHMGSSSCTWLGHRRMEHDG